MQNQPKLRNIAQCQYSRLDLVIGYTMFDVTSVTITCVKCSSFIFWALHYVTFTLPLFSGLIPSSPIWHYKSWVTCLPIKLSWMLFLWLVSIVHKNPISSVTG
uniref:Uncharacterized protein n=1 Tax=Cacopsylla melanoneura TaxID=428564 RepID=A0A8D8XCC6_9HEMI